MTYRPTDRQTDMRCHREVSTQIIVMVPCCFHSTSHPLSPLLDRWCLYFTQFAIKTAKVSHYWTSLVVVVLLTPRFIGPATASSRGEMLEGGKGAGIIGTKQLLYRNGVCCILTRNFLVVRLVGELVHCFFTIIVLDAGHLPSQTPSLDVTAKQNFSTMINDFLPHTRVLWKYSASYIQCQYWIFYDFMHDTYNMIS